MMNASNVEDIAWSFWSLLGEGRVEEALALLDDDGFYWVSSFGDRDDRPMRTMKEFFRRAVAAVPMTFTKRGALVSGDRVALEVESYAQTPEGLYNNCYCFIMTVHDYKIVRVNEYVDTQHAANVLIPQIKHAFRNANT
jgi:ketosteroid isomerase-like protein